MLALIPYIVKVVIISCIMYTYYLLILRDKKFHHFNRFYLLAALVLSAMLPLIHFESLFIFQETNLPTIISKDVVSENIIISASSDSVWNTANVFNGLYLLVAVTLGILFFISILRIFRIGIKGRSNLMNGVVLIQTNAKGTPFSFFKRIFWNPEMDMKSDDAIRMLNHERTHCRQWHSIDKIIARILCIAFWMNPFFWLIKNEINLVHEFLADQSSFQSDGDSFSRVVLQGIYPGYTWSLTNSFYYSPLKRRIMMILKNNQKRVGYIGRLLVLPLAIGLFIFFSTKANALIESSVMIPVVTDTVIQGSDINSVSVEKGFVIITFKDGTTKTVTRSELSKIHIVDGDKNVAPPNGMDKLFTKVEVESQFPGGSKAWAKYIAKVLNQYVDEFDKGDYGTCVLRFVVDKNGNVSDVRATTMKGTRLAEVAINAIRKGPKWIPAKQNGHSVNAYRELPVTLNGPVGN